LDGRVSESPFTDLDRPPLRTAVLSRALVRPGGLWREVDVVPETGSTNADLVAAARGAEGPATAGGAEGAARAARPGGEGTVLVAESQTAGRGRLDRRWVSPPRAGLTFSILLRPAVPPARRVWVSLLTGVAVAEAVHAATRVALSEPLDARLKWPNDVMVGERKLAGILAEAIPGSDAVVVGVGLNVTTTAGELADTRATSLAVERSGLTDRDPLLRAILRAFERWYRDWTAAGGDPGRSGLRRAYLDRCGTVGREVRVRLPGDETLIGEASDVDDDGRLVVGGRPVSAGEVVHVR
jgi:BirA family transcriptional regulator, biotin operon repressor / biotin---[acetyl-CoA-carboxylase] ligase